MRVIISDVILKFNRSQSTDFELWWVFSLNTSVAGNCGSVVKAFASSLGGRQFEPCPSCLDSFKLNT